MTTTRHHVWMSQRAAQRKRGIINRYRGLSSSCPTHRGANVRVLGLLVAALTGLCVLADDKPQFQFTSKREDDRIAVKKEDGRTVFDITSPFGISDLTIERTGDAWPDQVVIRLNLSSLEYYIVQCEKAAVWGRARNKNHDDMELTIDGKKVDPRDPKIEHFVDFRMLDKNGKPAETVPLDNGHFDLRLPKSFFRDNPKKIKLEWVDFYRR